MLGFDDIFGVEMDCVILKEFNCSVRTKEYDYLYNGTFASFKNDLASLLYLGDAKRIGTLWGCSQVNEFRHSRDLFEWMGSLDIIYENDIRLLLLVLLLINKEFKNYFLKMIMGYQLKQLTDGNKLVLKKINVFENGQDAFITPHIYKSLKEELNSKSIQLITPGGIQENICKMCFENEINVVLIKCGHLVVCERCSKNKLKECPICRKQIVEIMKVYRT